MTENGFPTATRLLASDKAFAAWGQALAGDPVMASAALEPAAAPLDRHQHRRTYGFGIVRV